MHTVQALLATIGLISTIAVRGQDFIELHQLHAPVAITVPSDAFLGLTTTTIAILTLAFHFNRIHFKEQSVETRQQSR